MKNCLSSKEQPTSNVRLVSFSQGVQGETPQELIAYCARVSNPSNQRNFQTASKLLSYCFNHGHVSIFEMADFTFEVTTSRAIAAQILRHRHFNYQEFSQRYAKATSFETYPARLQDPSNKQASLPLSEGEAVYHWFMESQRKVQAFSQALYEEALSHNIAKEQARFLLPLSTTTVLYMKGSIRSWIHYLAIRRGPDTQKEHRDIAFAIKNILDQHIPDIMPLLDQFSIYTSNPYD